MINRRLLRTKALQVLYAYYQTDQASSVKSEKELFHSIDKTYELYFLFLQLLVDLADYAGERIRIKQSKYFPTPDEVNPNLRFIENPVLMKIKDSEAFMNYTEKHRITWVNHPELVRNIYQKLIELKEYEEYMSRDEIRFKDHRQVLTAIFGELVFPNELLHQILEERSIYWNDDLEFAGSMALKTLEQTKESVDIRFLPKFKHEEDREFAKDLFRKTIVHEGEMRDLIRKYAHNWEFDRIALMDVFIMQMALTEAIYFPSIPVKVTLNEYIDIAKFYSTEKSSTFINGILDKAFADLREEKRIVKTGRGLIGEMD